MKVVQSVAGFDVEMEKLNALSDDELVRRFLDLGKQFDEMKIKLSEAKKSLKANVTEKKEDMFDEDDCDLDDVDMEEKNDSDVTKEADNTEAEPVDVSDLSETLEETVNDNESFTEPEESSNIWHFDSSIPSGWKTKLIPNGKNQQSRRIFKNPQDRVFYSRRSAKKFMITDNSYSEEDIRMMDYVPFTKKSASKLHEETDIDNTVEDIIVEKQVEKKLMVASGDGYEYGNPTVPAGWGVKKINNGPKLAPKKHFRDPNGLVFTSRRSAYDHMLESGVYGEAEVELMKSYVRAKKNKKDRRKKFSYDDPTLPRGWGIKSLSNGVKQKPKKILRSPDGIVFMSRKKALDHMIENKRKYEEADVELMKSSVKKKKTIASSRTPGFKYGNSTVPEGWGIKLLSNGKKLKPKKIFCNPRGEKFVSRSKAYLHMLNTGKYSSQDMNILKEPLHQAVVVKLELEAKQNSKTKVVEVKPEMMQSTSLSEEKEMKEIKKEILEETQLNSLKQLVDDVEKTFNSSTESFDTTTEASDEEKRKPRKNKSNQFRPHDLLPEGWLLATYTLKKGGEIVRFKSPDGSIFKSKKTLAEAMREEGVPEEIIENSAKIGLRYLRELRIKKEEPEADNDIETATVVESFKHNDSIIEEPNDEEEVEQELIKTEVDRDEEVQPVEKEVPVVDLDDEEDAQVTPVEEEPNDSDTSLDENVTINEDDEVHQDDENDERDQEDSIMKEMSDMFEVEESTETTGEESATSEPSEDLGYEENTDESRPRVTIGPVISLTEENYDILSSVYIKNILPSDQEICSLCAETGLERRVVRWFFLKIHRLVRENNVQCEKKELSLYLESVKFEYMINQNTMSL